MLTSQMSIKTDSALQRIVVNRPFIHRPLDLLTICPLLSSLTYTSALQRLRNKKYCMYTHDKQYAVLLSYL